MLHFCKFLLIFLIIAVSFLTASAQQTPLPTPPGTVRLQDNLFIDKHEVANIHWKEFLYYIQRDSGNTYYRKMLPDTLVWAQRNLPQAQISSIDLTKNYFSAADYHSFPVVGISYAQAQVYARWRSYVVSELLNQPEELERLGLQGKRVVVEYRLPTEEEWMEAAAGGLSPKKYPYGYKRYLQRALRLFEPAQAYEQLNEPKPPFKSFRKSLRKAKVPQFQVVAELPGSILLAPEYPKPIAAGPTNTLELANTIGNVAEMTAGPGIAKGGSFMHTMEDSQISDQQAYYGPAPWLGVRYVATVEVLSE